MTSDTKKRKGRYMVICVGNLEFSGDAYPEIDLRTNNINKAIAACASSRTSSETDHFVLDAKLGRVVWQRSEGRILLASDLPRWADDDQLVRWFGDDTPPDAREGDQWGSGDLYSILKLQGGTWVKAYPMPNGD